MVSTAVTALQMFSEKIVIENTCTSDFLLADLMQSEKPTDLFLVVPPSDLARAGNLFRLIIELLVIRNTEVLGQNKHKCLLLIDEFPAFGKMDSLVRQLGYIAGYGFKALLIFQGLEQIKNIYKNNFEMLVNRQLRYFLRQTTMQQEIIFQSSWVKKRFWSNKNPVQAGYLQKRIIHGSKKSVRF